MQTPNIPSGPNGPARSAHHPLMIAAAIAIVLFCLVGTAAIMGWIPSSLGADSKREQLSEAEKTVLASRLAQNDSPPPPAASKPRPLADYNDRTDRTEREQPVRLAQAEPAPVRSGCANCGNIESVREITHRAQGTGLGAAGGAVLGGLLGHQVGGGHGKQLATVAGVVGGAVVGNQVEGNMKATRSYEIRVRLDNGDSRTFNQQSAAGWRDGDRVRIVNGALRPVH